MSEGKRVNYLNKAAAAADKVYNKIVAIRCRHRDGALTYDQMLKQRVVTASSSASIAFQEAGILLPGKTISHSLSVGGSAATILKAKNTVIKSVKGIESLLDDKADIEYVGLTYSKLPRRFKQKGCLYIQDNNVCISAGGGSIYSCNNAIGSQLDSKGRYKKNKITSGYAFTSPILVVVLPKK